MKSKYINLLLILLSVASLKTFAQNNQQQKNDAVLLLFKKYINQKNTDLIYALASQQYKAGMPEKNLAVFLETEIYPLGKIKQSSLISLTDTGSYKLVFESGKLEFSFSLDKNNKFTFITFNPYTAIAVNKPFPVATSNPLQTIMDKQVDTAARAYIQKSNTVGLSIGVLKDGKIYTYGYGKTEKEKDRLPDANTIFEIGSITKTFTATILAYYVTSGKISLNDPITKYLPDSVAANPQLQKIKIVNLSNHTSGLSALPGNFDNKSSDLLNPYKNYTESMFFSDLKNCKLNTEPGEVYAYSNQAVGLLGIILERISGKTYEQLIRQIITMPLNMNSTFQRVPAQLNTRFAKVYDADGDQTRAWDFDALAACGCIHSSVNDLLSYAKNNLSSTASELSKSFELTHQITFSKNPVVALGWHLFIVNGTKYYWHNGATGGCRSFLIFNVEKNVAVVVLSNACVDADDVGESIVKKCGN